MREDDFYKKKTGLRESEILNFANPVPFSLNHLETLWLVCSQTGHLTNLLVVSLQLRGREVSASLLKLLIFSAVLQNSGCPFPSSAARTVCSM